MSSLTVTTSPVAPALLDIDDEAQVHAMIEGSALATYTFTD